MNRRRGFFRVVSDRLTHNKSDLGVALIFVVGTMLILASLAVTAIAYTMAGEKLARRDQDHSAAMAAAQAGVDDYISHLNRNDDYYLKLDCTNKALQGPTSSVNTCGWNASTESGWLPVDSAKTGPNDAHFHYSVNATTALSEGTVALVVTGRVNGTYRSVESAVGKGGTTDYVYYTDFEATDPANQVAYYNITAHELCGGQGYDKAKYWWQGRSTAPVASCQQAQFQSGDILVGSVFSNDSIWSVGSTFTSTVSTADKACDLSEMGNVGTWVKCFRSGSSGINYNGFKPMSKSAETMKDTSAEFADHPGCHYYGSTRILFTGDAHMTVWNKKASNGNQAPLGIAPEGEGPPSCGSLNDLDSAAGAKVPVPNNMVVYTADAPSGTPRSQCVAGQLGGPTGWTLPLGSYNGTKPTPTVNSTYTADVTMLDQRKYCQAGNLYVEGVLSGRLTVSAAQSVVVIGDLVLNGGLSGTDMLGLVATDSVEIFNPFLTTISTARDCAKLSNDKKSCSNFANTYSWAPDGYSSVYYTRDVNKLPSQWAVPSRTSSAWTNVTGWPRQFNDPTVSTQVSGLQIMGSIQALLHSFTGQFYSSGTHRGKLQVNGSIAQRWRGPVGLAGTNQAGYLKNYMYDTRLRYSAPPYFPRWEKSQWKQRYFGEVEVNALVKK